MPAKTLSGIWGIALLLFQVVLMLISVFGCHIFPAWFNLYGSAAKPAAHGLVISSTAFLLLSVIRVAGYYYQATGKIKDSSLLIYGDAFFCPAVMPVCFTFILRVGRRLAGYAGFTRYFAMCVFFGGQKNSS